MDQQPPPIEEPTVLDWFRSILRLRPIPIPAAPLEARPKPPAHQEVLPTDRATPIVEKRLALQWRHLRLPAGLVVALLGQIVLESAPRRDVMPALGIVLYIVALGLVGWAMWKEDLGLLSAPEGEAISKDGEARATWLGLGALFAVLAFLTAGGNVFRLSTVVSWLGATASLLLAFWEGENPVVRIVHSLRDWLRHPRLTLSLDGWALAFWLVLGMAAFFRFVHLSTVPLEMWSDQAEKLLDVADVLAGKYAIYFPRNSGREAIQFYLAAATARWLGTGVTFLTLKIGTALVGWLTLPFIYGFARELVDRRVGLAAMALAGVAMWPNIISRAGLRFPLYAFFAAVALYLLVRGLRRHSRNEILLAGVAAGIGLHGYSPARVLPIILAIGVLVYAFHPIARGQRSRLVVWSLAASLLGLVVFLPLLRVAMEMPDNFLFRALSRLGTAERPLPGPPLAILVSNLWNGLSMFNWNSGQIWVVSITGKPLLDWVTGALFVLGCLLCLLRYGRRRHWADVFALLSIPLLMTPSILALAFPGENPAPNRASGVMVPVFALAGWALVAVGESIRASWPGRSGRLAALGCVGALLVLAAATNYRLTFDVFYPAYRRGAWNTSDGGHVIQAYAQSIGTYESAHVIPYPFWWDTRLVGIHAGRPLTDYALAREQLDTVAFETGPQLFLYHPEDTETADRLRGLFPTGQLREFVTDMEGHDFMIYFVPERVGRP